MKIRTTPSIHDTPTGMSISPARVLLSLFLVILATAVQVELCRAQLRGLVPEGIEVLTRGPVHEAFAGLQTYDPQPGRIVSRLAPLAIEEIAPNRRPTGVNVAWIPGYWTWDDERADFIWLSGTWRALPPGREWVPGYWATVPAGYQWTSGYWSDSSNRQATYLPPPPPSLEAGPYIPAPSTDFLWTPGCWIWVQARYAWQPGFWALGQQNWDWIPAHYTWTPRGLVFVSGYWDHPVERRGLLFAPVWFDPTVVGTGRFRYSPAIAVDLNLFAEHLFLRPTFQHYYFGDYYAATYTSAGFFSSLAFTRGHHGYDSIHSHQVWEHRRDPDWQHRMDVAFQDRRDHSANRPARTWPPTRAKPTDPDPHREPAESLAKPYDQLLRRDRGLLPLQSVSGPERAQLTTRADDVQKARELRRAREATPSRSLTERPTSIAPVRVRVPKSPIVSLPNRKLGGNQTPPRSHRAPPSSPDSAP